MKKIVWLSLVPILLFSSLVLFAAPAAAVAAKDPTNISIAKGKVYLNLKDADIKSVLQIFAKATGINIVAGDDVTGKVTVTFSGIYPKDGLEAVLRTKGLDWFEEEGTIFVSNKKIMRTYYLTNARPSDLQETIKSVLPDGSVVTANDSYNALVIQTTSDYLPRLERLINELDVSPLQVMVEVRMIEINYTDNANLGVDGKYTYQGNINTKIQDVALAGKPTDLLASGLYAQLISGNVEAYLSALATKVNYNVVANPRITTMNNKEANILIGNKDGYKTSIISQTSTTQVINFLSTGTELTMLPNISKSGFIRMKIYPKVSTGKVTIDGLPQEKTTETKSEVMVKDGQTFVIGGLIKESNQETNKGIPFLMDIPLLGTLFRRTDIVTEKGELLIFVTPTILTPENLSALSDSIPEMEKKSSEFKARLVH